MGTDMKKWARVHSLRDYCSVKQKLCKQACRIFAFFCESQPAGIIRAHPRNPWVHPLQPFPAHGVSGFRRAENFPSSSRGPVFSRGFTLLELLVAMAVASLLLVVLFSIIGDTMTSSRRTVQTLMAANSAAAAMDTLAADLGGLMPLDGSGEYLYVAPETVGGVATAYLRFLTQSPNNGTNAVAGGQPCFVAYRVGQYDSKTLKAPATGSPAYALFRTTSNATATFGAIGDASINASATAAEMDDFFANNVVEFSVQPMRGTTALVLNTLSLKGNSPTGTARPDALVVTLVTLDDTGAQRLRDGESLQNVKSKHGRVLTRRIGLEEGFAP